MARIAAASSTMLLLLATTLVGVALALDVPEVPDAVFLEAFQDATLGKFVKSLSPDYAGMPLDVSTSSSTPSTSSSSFHGGVEVGDFGAVLTREARRYAFTAPFTHLIKLTDDKPFVVQYEARFQQGLSCGGAYIKLYEGTPGFRATAVTSSTPYVIMFGPDHCGATDKTHFIVRYKNPISGVAEEKHLTTPPQAKATDTVVHLYTLILRPDDTYTIKINNVVEAEGSLQTDFTPPFLPSLQIDDPTDSKPLDWVDDETIPDPTASKPVDWDDSAPVLIPDEDAKMPSGWLVDAPEFINDPLATKPEGWDDDEDGDWIAPQIPNPACEEAAGCGQWERPSKKNPAYKGKWEAPLIPNPAYKGKWAPRQIDNPTYFTLEQSNSLHHLSGAAIGGIGVEVWTMNGGILFDNFLVTRNEDSAAQFAAATWRPKYEAQLLAQTEETRAAERQARAEAAEEGGVMEKLAFYVAEVFELARENPLATLSTVLVILLALSVACYILCCAADQDDGTAFDVEEFQRRMSSAENADVRAAAIAKQQQYRLKQQQQKEKEKRERQHYLGTEGSDDEEGEEEEDTSPAAKNAELDRKIAELKHQRIEQLRREQQQEEEEGDEDEDEEEEEERGKEEEDKAEPEEVPVPSARGDEAEERTTQSSSNAAEDGTEGTSSSTKKQGGGGGSVRRRGNRVA